MEDGTFGVVEIILAFGVVLALAVWELVRNRRELARIRSKEGADRFGS